MTVNCENETVHEQPALPRQIRNIRGLFEVFESSDPAIRFQAMKAVQAQPQAALTFGIYQGLDVIDMLLAKTKRSEGTLEWFNWVGALMAFRDPRVTEFFLTVLTTEEVAQFLFSAARYLADVEAPPLWNRLVSLLLQNNNSVRARAVAPLLASSPRLTAAARLRVALLSPADLPAPPFDESTAPAWLSELHGPFRTEACIALQQQGQPAWTALCSCWTELTEDDQLFLLDWGSDKFSNNIVGLLTRALQSNSSRVNIKALHVLSSVPCDEALQALRALAASYLSDPNPNIREAAVSAGPPGVDWRSFLNGERASAVRQAALAQLAQVEGEQAIPDLLRFLRSNDWQLRAASAAALTRLGTAAAEAVKPLVQDSDLTVQVAAVRVLLTLGQDVWLAQALNPGDKSEK